MIEIDKKFSWKRVFLNLNEDQSGEETKASIKIALWVTYIIIACIAVSLYYMGSEKFLKLSFSKFVKDNYKTPAFIMGVSAILLRIFGQNIIDALYKLIGRSAPYENKSAMNEPQEHPLLVKFPFLKKNLGFMGFIYTVLF